MEVRIVAKGDKDLVTLWIGGMEERDLKVTLNGTPMDKFSLNDDGLWVIEATVVDGVDAIFVVK